MVSSICARICFATLDVLRRPSPSTIVVLSLSMVTFLARRIFERDVLELDAEVFGDRTATREDSDVFEHRLAAVAEARCLHGSGVSVPRSLLTTSVAALHPDIFRDDEERTSTEGHLLEDRGAGPSSS